jgi:hypothetical protein
MREDAIPNNVPFVKDVERTVPSAQERINNAHATQAEQDTDWRKPLFWVAVTLVPLCVVASIGAGFWYMKASHGLPDPAVLSAWFGAGMVQVVGILYTITKHLFPEQDAGKK